ncbi:MAG: hypothetical protein B6D39_09870 [Anaerolineae bacterium UTCFX2]|jgi:hypothetical protein|nr:hypothetical protein [Anaerolineales bacterium]OQY89265.1 MAG: hypothetical protein B6D39_09870 [Anaerolineae bacterium UTCFX2]
MKRIFFLVFLSFLLPILISACVKSQKSLRQQEALEIAWAALKPSTVSKNRDYWEIHEARMVYGKDVVADFSAVQHTSCAGPMLPENKPIKISTEYWYIKVVPHPEVVRKEKGTDSTEKVTIVPEPAIQEAYFLIDPFNGGIVARRLVCKTNQ